IYGTVERNFLRCVFYDGVTGTTFYGIVVMDNSQWVNVAHNIGDRSRHLVVTTARTQGQGHYGQPFFINIHHNHAYDSMAGGAGRSYAYESHGFGRFITFDGNTAHGCFAGIRVENGQDTKIVNNSFKGYGYQGIIIGGSGTSIRNLLIANNHVDEYTAEVTSGLPAAIAFVANGVNVDNVKILGNLLTRTSVSNAGAGITVGKN